MGHFHGHSDHALQASYHHLVLGVARHSLASGFHPGQASSLFEAKGNQVKTLSFFPVLDLRAVVDLSRPYDCPDLSVFDLDVPVHWARRGIGFHTRDSRTHPSSRHFAPRRRSLRVSSSRP